MSERIYRPNNVTRTKATGSNEANDQTAKVQSQPFPIGSLPPWAADMARAICSTERVPESLVGSCVLGVVSASLGTGLQIRSGPERISRANLYIAASGESGSGKSETFRHVWRPFREFEDELITKWQLEQLPGLQAEMELLESEISRLKKPLAKNYGPVVSPGGSKPASCGHFKTSQSEARSSYHFWLSDQGLSMAN